jgi:hypothetical protein
MVSAVAPDVTLGSRRVADEFAGPSASQLVAMSAILLFAALCGSEWQVARVAKGSGL